MKNLNASTEVDHLSSTLYGSEIDSSKRFCMAGNQLQPFLHNHMYVCKGAWSKHINYEGQHKAISHKLSMVHYTGRFHLAI